MIAESCIPLPQASRPGRKLEPLTALLRQLAAGPMNHSLHFQPEELGEKDPRRAQMVLAAKAKGAAGNGRYSTRRTETGNRIWKVAEPCDPPVQFIHGRDAAGDNPVAVAG